MGKKPTSRTTKRRTAEFKQWVADNFTRTDTSNYTTIGVSQLATTALGFPVSPNRVAREFYRRGLPFRRSPGDPPEPAWTKAALVQARADYLEERVRALEVKVFGKVRRTGFSPRSRGELVKTGAGQVAGSDQNQDA